MTNAVATATNVAPIWRRVVAQLVDQLVVLLPVVAVAIAFGIHDLDDIQEHSFAINIAVVAIAFTYEFLMIAIWGRTAGKFALGTRAVRVDTGGAVVWSSSAIRALVPLAANVIPGIGMILSLLVYSRAFFDPGRQGWHDKAAGTVVIMARSA